MSAKNGLYEVNVSVLNWEGRDRPKKFAGAMIACYVVASDALAATDKAKFAVEHLKYKFDGLVGDAVREIPIENWSSYVGATWPADVGHLPVQEDLPDLIEKDVVFFGPIVEFLRN